MKKSTKKIIMALIIVFIFGASSLAFVANNVFAPTEQQVTQLDKYVIDGDVNAALTDQYIRNGYTILRFYYAEGDPLIQIADQIPETYTTNSNQVQVFVLKIKANETYIKITNLYGENEVYNLTYGKIFESLCDYLTVTPSECGLQNLLLNQTNTTQ